MSIGTVRKLDQGDEVFQNVGTVVEMRGKELVVENGSGRFDATPAVSCLVEPEKDDEVLFAGRRNGPLYVLAVLERQGEQATRIKADGDLSLLVKDGKFTVVTAEGVELVSSKDINMTSAGINMRAAEGQVFFDKLTYLGRKVFAEVEQAKTFFGLFDSVLERFSQRVKRSYRWVEQLDQVRSNQIDYQAKENLRLRGQNALVNADLLVKIDGDQIHLG